MVTIDRLTTGYVGLSTDEKPTGCRNGDTFVEMDTSTLYAYDEEGQQWVKQSGSGGGSSDGETAEVTFINSAVGYQYEILINGVEYPVVDSTVVEIPLSNGEAWIYPSNFFHVDTNVIPTFTGDITPEKGGFKITGDGSITAAGVRPTRS